MTYGPPCGIISPVSDERMLSFADLQLPPLLKVWTTRYADRNTQYAPPSRVLGITIARALRQQQKPHPFPGKVPFPKFDPHNALGDGADFYFFERDDRRGDYPKPAHVSALITRLAEDGIEPFVTSILGTDAETPWLKQRDYEALKARILAAEQVGRQRLEEQYQEAATRWLVYDRMRQIANALVPGPGRNFPPGPDGTRAVDAYWNGQLETYMPMLCSLWGYMTRAIEADHETHYAPSDWKSVARTSGPIDLGGLR